eukprot:SAG22_NODE_382_length_11344_cov_41.312228_2_plen_891_part_00
MDRSRPSDALSSNIYGYILDQGKCGFTRTSLPEVQFCASYYDTVTNATVNLGMSETCHDTCSKCLDEEEQYQFDLAHGDVIDEDVTLCHETWHSLFLMASALCLLASAVFVSTASVDNIDAEIRGDVVNIVQAPPLSDDVAEAPASQAEEPAENAVASFDGPAQPKTQGAPKNLVLGTFGGAILTCIIVIGALALSVDDSAGSTVDAPPPPPPEMSCAVVDGGAGQPTPDRAANAQGRCIREGMDYGGSGNLHECGYAPLIHIFAESTTFPSPVWYTGTGRTVTIDPNLTSEQDCQVHCQQTAGCDFFSYQYQLDDSGVYHHECYLKAGFRDNYCDYYSPWLEENKQEGGRTVSGTEWRGAAGPKFCTPDVSEFYWTNSSGRLGWTVVREDDHSGYTYSAGVFKMPDGSNIVEWGASSDWLMSGMGPQPFAIRDQAHDPFIIRSPAFYGPKMATWIGQGGRGRSESVCPQDQETCDEGTVAEGFLGWGLRDEATGQFVASITMCRGTAGKPVFMGPMEGRETLPATAAGDLCRATPESEGRFADCGAACNEEGGIHQWQHFNWDLSSVTDESKLYTFDIIDNSNGGWSHIETQDFTVYHDGLKASDGALDFTRSFDGHISVFDANMQGDLPTQDMTVELWVKFTGGGADWAGPIGAFQDDGDAERGWNLQTRCLQNAAGNRDCHVGRSLQFSLSTMAADDGDGSMTYLGDPARCTFEAGGGPLTTEPESDWIHWAASYDGQSMVMYEDGVEVARDSTSQGGAINYPPAEYESAQAGWFTIGAYHDANEYYPFPGMLDEVKVWHVAQPPQLACHAAVNAGAVRPSFYWEFNDGPDGPIADGTVIDATIGQNGVAHGDVHRYRGKCRVSGTERESGARPCTLGTEGEMTGGR